MSEHSIETIVLGATGYVAGELMRLVAQHPVLQLRAAVARSSAGEAVSSIFPHLAPAYGDEVRVDTWDTLPTLLDDLQRAGSAPAVFSALPHGSGARLAQLIDECRSRDISARVVDLSADFRLGTTERFASTYGGEHPAPEHLSSFTCALPDLEREQPREHVAHPGCFTTAVSLACRPLAALDLARGPFRVCAVTGSTGSGRDPKPGTHHPTRHGNFKAYGALNHRHVPEMEALIGAGADDIEVLFVPHSGPFARGIHATIHVTLDEELTREELSQRVAEFYAWTPFVHVTDTPPDLKHVVGTNRCHLWFETRGREAVVVSVIDNLTKGAAGGAVQWMNRLFDLEPDTGLNFPGLGWN